MKITTRVERKCLACSNSDLFCLSFVHRGVICQYLRERALFCLHRSLTSTSLFDVNRCVLCAYISPYFFTTWNHFWTIVSASPVDPAIHLDYAMYQPHHRVCLFCDRSVERIRRYTLTRDLQNEHQHTVQNIIQAVPREITFNNEEYLCHNCWTRARRGRLPAIPATEDEPPAEHAPSVEDAPAMGNPPAVENPPVVEDQLAEDDILGQNVTFHLPGNYCRAPNTTNACMVYNCTNNTRRRVPKSLKVQLLINNNYYVPPHARVCQEHLEDNTWDILFTAPNRCFDFSPQHVFEMLELLKEPRSRIIDFENLTALHDEDLHYWTGRTRDEFEKLFNETPLLAQRLNNPRTALGIILAKLRTGEPNERLATFFNMSRTNLERRIKIARECLESDFIPRHLGFEHISREQIIERNLAVPNALFANNQEAVVICDGTYMYIQKSSNFSFQKATYSLQKSLNLLKPFLVVTCDGHIIEVCGPYAATTNDATILKNLLDGPDRVIHWLLHPGDIFILDRGFRDSIASLESHGYVGIMPQSQTRRGAQLSTLYANKSRMCTICRWPVEVVNGRLKRDFKIFNQEFCNLAMSHFQTDLRIAAAITNAYHVDIIDNANASQYIRIARERLNVVNHLADYVDERRLNRNRANFENIAVSRVNVASFPMLTPEELTLFAVGTYQIKLAPSYYSEHIRTTETFIIQNYNGRLIDLSDFWMPTSNVQLIRANIKSRHTSSKLYRSYILIDGNNHGLDSVKHYCCSCFTGRRTIGSCAHVVCLVWFLGWARHQDVVRRPALFLDTIIIDDDEDDDH